MNSWDVYRRYRKLRSSTEDSIVHDSSRRVALIEYATFINDPQHIVMVGMHHMLHQGKRAHDNGVCLYRTDDGLECVFGALIPNTCITPNLEGATASRVFAEGLLPHVLHNALVPYQSLIAALQSIHDNVENWQSWQKMMDATYLPFAEMPAWWPLLAFLPKLCTYEFGASRDLEDHGSFDEDAEQNAE